MVLLILLRATLFIYFSNVTFVDRASFSKFQFDDSMPTIRSARQLNSILNAIGSSHYGQVLRIGRRCHVADPGAVVITLNWIKSTWIEWSNWPRIVWSWLIKTKGSYNNSYFRKIRKTECENTHNYTFNESPQSALQFMSSTRFNSDDLITSTKSSELNRRIETLIWTQLPFRANLLLGEPPSGGLLYFAPRLLPSHTPLLLRCRVPLQPPSRHRATSVVNMAKIVPLLRVMACPICRSLSHLDSIRRWTRGRWTLIEITWAGLLRVVLRK